MNDNGDSTSEDSGLVLSLSLSNIQQSAAVDLVSPELPNAQHPDMPDADLVKTMTVACITDMSDDEDFEFVANSEFWDQVYEAEARIPAIATLESARLATAPVKETNIEIIPVDAMPADTTLFNSAPVAKRKHIGEDVFSEAAVKEWQGPRIKAWEGRYMNPEGYYYRFVVPGEGQQNGGWSASENQLFMQRYNEWQSNGWKIGASWGMFSQSIPHRVGYQCMNYYRKLISDGKLRDDSYAVVDGKLKQIHKDRAPPGEIPTTTLGKEWETEEVKQIERQVNTWLKTYHHRSGSAFSLSTPTRKTPRVSKASTTRKSVSDLDKKQLSRKRLFVLDDEEAIDCDYLETEPERVHLRSRTQDWQKEWYFRLKSYKAFMQPFLHHTAYESYWLAKQVWRRGQSTREIALKKTRRVMAPLENCKSLKSSGRTQAAISKLFPGPKKLKVDTPEAFLTHVRIPNEPYSGVHQITPLAVSRRLEYNQDKTHYYQLDDMKDCVEILDTLVNRQTSTQSPLEGVLVDPPWEFYIHDGRNDGRCRWNLMDVALLLEKVLVHMSGGLVFIWTHKLIQADVLRMMDALDCKYVENLVWFKKTINNVPLDRPSPYVSSAKEILLMFKKGEGFELRHQRSADVIIDFEQPTNQWIHQEFTEPKPPAVYDMIETLLPRAGYNKELQRGRLLELWAKKAASRREGWIAFHQRKF